ncbi:hypothetical protein D3C85_1733770 [compost metagenome]
MHSVELRPGRIADVVQVHVGQFCCQRSRVEQRGLADIGDRVDQCVPGIAAGVAGQGGILAA